MSDINDTNLKFLLINILNGYNEVYLPLSKTHCFLKHVSLKDSVFIEAKRDFFLKEIASHGIPTQNEKEESIVKDGLWSKEKTQDIFYIQENIKQLKITKTKVNLQSQIDAVDREIDFNTDRLKKLEIEKNNLMGLTAEILAGIKINDLFIRSIFFKDNKLFNFLFSEEEFNELDDEKIDELRIIFENTIENLKPENLKKIALFPPFVNLLCLSNGLYDFWGKPAIELTLFQTELYTHGTFYKNIIQNSESRPPIDVLQDPEKLENWYNLEKNNKNLLNKHGSDAIIVGKTNNSHNTVNNLIEKAKKKGSSLDMGDIFNLK